MVTKGGCVAVCWMHEIRCLDPATGAAVWSRVPGGQLASCGAYDDTRDLLFVGTLDKAMWALRGIDGSRVRPSQDGPSLVRSDARCLY